MASAGPLPTFESFLASRVNETSYSYGLDDSCKQSFQQATDELIAALAAKGVDKKFIDKTPQAKVLPRIQGLKLFQEIMKKCGQGMNDSRLVGDALDFVYELIHDKLYN